MREAATICHRPCKLTFDRLILKVVSESRVTWATSVPILVFLSLSILDLGPYVRERQTEIDVRRQTHILTPLYLSDTGLLVCSQKAKIHAYQVSV